MLENLANGSIEDNDLPSPLPVKDFEGKIDTSQPILAGHSFGAAATILALSKDTRFKWVFINILLLAFDLILEFI